MIVIFMTIYKLHKQEICTKTLFLQEKFSTITLCVVMSLRLKFFNENYTFALDSKDLTTKFNNFIIVSVNSNFI